MEAVKPMTLGLGHQCSATSPGRTLSETAVHCNRKFHWSCGVWLCLHVQQINNPPSVNTRCPLFVWPHRRRKLHHICIGPITDLNLPSLFDPTHLTPPTWPLPPGPSHLQDYGRKSSQEQENFHKRDISRSTCGPWGRLAVGRPGRWGSILIGHSSASISFVNYLTSLYFHWSALLTSVTSVTSVTFLSLE